jgi:histidine triad (HIT) family protein
MEEGDCLFCLVTGDTTAFKIYEDDKYIAILDTFPNVKGQTIVLPKKHIESYLFDLNEEELSDFMKATKEVVKLMENKLGAKRMRWVLEGTGINHHLHAKLYPALTMKKQYEGRRAKDSELRELQKKITGQ